ncbi:aminotransferase-like domain-containing protein [Tannockella kyphosi]|uniref:aminotransferase-like domain-containing protein n=1 Tax=Tannockella kyphosi TaxID=2899121 RepID=UPI002010D6A4|nr:PLP-dependent aminotransferase family protein [Tannockella kyphosi]
MKYRYSNRIEKAKASAIREILKMMNDPEMISFGGGNPAVETFPIESLKNISSRLFEESPTKVLEYGITEGDIDLRQEALQFFSNKEDIKKEYDQVLITSGSQQIMDFIAKVLCNEDDKVICENPSFLGALNAFKSNGATLVGCDIEADGINLEQVEKALQSDVKPAFIYTIPNFQNPTGITMSYEKRKKLYELACKYEVPILEDNPYGDLRFEGQAIPSIKSMDEEGIVIYAASLSKIIAPGMRVAMLLAHQDIVGKVTVAKQSNDVHSNAWSQKVMANFLHETDMAEHLKKLQAVYSRKCALMLSKMEECFDEAVSWTIPEGGMFIWVTLPDTISMLEFVQEAIKNKVAVVPGNAFYSDDSIPCQSFRMNFSMPSDENIIKGVEILGTLSKQMNK